MSGDAEEGEGKTLAVPEAFILSCVGTGFTNTAKKTLVLLLSSSTCVTVLIFEMGRG